jgi:hypothetical protein
MTKPTPGPWRAESWHHDGDQLATIASRAGVVAQLSGRRGFKRLSRAKVDADANPIAAAPDLLAVAEAIVSDIAGLEPHLLRGDLEWFRAIIDEARAAIAKARGEEE